MHAYRLVGVALGVAAGCGGHERTAPPPSNPTSSIDLPDGWVRFDPAPGRIECAQWSKQTWQLAADRHGVQITATTDLEPDSGPPLPFTLPQTEEPRGRRHSVAVTDGFLVGFDAGEWGGSLTWFSPDGTKHLDLGDTNVRGLVALGPNVVLALEGLDHLTLREGNASWVERDAGGTWRVGAVVPLDAGPYTFARDGDTVYIVTATSVSRIDRDRHVTVLQPMPEASLYPNSMVVDDSRRIWIAMRGLVLLMTHAGDHFLAEWLVPRGCQRAIHSESACTCAGD